MPDSKEKKQLPKEDIDKMQTIIDMAQDILQETGKLGGMFFLTFIQDSREKTACIPMKARTEQEKDLLALFIRHMAKKVNASSIFFVTEAWVIENEHAKEYMANMDKYSSISEHPHAKEIVAFCYENKDGEWTGRADIKERMFGEIKWEQPPKLGGRFTNLLK